MLDFTFLYCQLCQDTLMHLYYWGILTLNNGKEETLDHVCKTCYEALINDTMINVHSCEKCESNCLILMRENYDLNINRGKKVRTYREYVKCDDCDNTFTLKEQTQLEDYRIKLAKRHIYR